MIFQIELSDENTAQIIEKELTTSLRKTLLQGDNQQFVLAAKSDQSELIGGLTASTSYGWLLIKTLWVAQQYRGSNIGRKLVDEAENKARTAACHSAWLDTSNPASKGFYDALGYEVFGELSNEDGQYPESHRRWFMKKVL